MTASQDYSIDDVSRNTGIGKDRLRVWERRYGFPNPRRNRSGARCYDADQLARLRAIGRQLDKGERPGKVVPAVAAEAMKPRSDWAELLPPGLPEPLAQALMAADIESVCQQLETLAAEQSSLDFVTQSCAPLLQAVGNAWLDGRLSIYQEHMLSERLIRLLQARSHQLRPGVDAGVALLATLPEERHGLGLLMVELLLRDQGLNTINLGVEVPLEDLVLACQGLEPGLLALSFSGMQKPAALRRQLLPLAQRLSAHLPIIAGGEAVRRLQRLPTGIHRAESLSQVPDILQNLTLAGCS